MKRWILAVALVLGCKGGAKREAPAVATRVVSLSPSTTETMFAIGAGNLMVGRSRYCDHPPEAMKLPQVGGYVDSNIEAIMALKPDLVLGARGPAGTSVTDRLSAHGIGVFFPETETFAQIEEMILEVGKRTAHEEGARKTVDAMRARTAEVERAVGLRPKPRVMIVFGLAPISVAGPGGFPDEMLRRAGGVNAVATGPAYPTLGMERVMALDPDVLIIAAMAEPQAAERVNASAPGWSSLRAVKQNRVVPIRDESILRSGPRVGDGVAVLARAIHPDVVIP
jgi:iron complex transport system substrate-binding protein